MAVAQVLTNAHQCQQLFGYPSIDGLPGVELASADMSQDVIV